MFSNNTPKHELSKYFVIIPSYYDGIVIFELTLSIRVLSYWSDYLKGPRLVFNKHFFVILSSFVSLQTLSLKDFLQLLQVIKSRCKMVLFFAAIPFSDFSDLLISAM